MAFFDKANSGEKKEENSEVASSSESISKKETPNSEDSSNASSSGTEKTKLEETAPSNLNLSNVKKEVELTELELGSTTNLLKDLEQGADLKTSLDLISDVIKKHDGKVTVKTLEHEVNLSKKQVSYYLRIMSKGGLIDIYYPTNPFASPQIKMKDDAILNSGFVEEEPSKEKKLIEKYTVISDYVVADVNIWSVPFENTPIYEIVPHKLSPGSQSLINTLIEEMARIIPVKLDDITDPRKMLELKEKFYEVAKDLIKKNVSDIDDAKLKVLTGVLLHNSYGLGDMDVLMSDNWLEEVAINGARQPISIYHKKYGWLKSTKRFESEQEIYNFQSQIGRKVGKQINNLEPIMDAHMLTGDRVAATLFPISTEGDTLTIRRFSRNPWTVAHMVDPKNHTMSLDMMAFLWMCLQYELNFLVVGGTASGKTSVLNTLASLIPPTNRIISIEDTREISLPDALHWNWVPMSSRPKNAEGVGEVTMLDLMVASLRMRPDRIIVGEIRRKQQAEAMFEAMHTGHSVCATMHADTSEQIKRRLTQPPIEIPEDEIQALHLVLVQYRDRRRGIRRSLEIAELMPGSGENKIDLNYLFRWRPRRDVFEKDNESIRIYEDLNLHTGMTARDIEEDIAQKKQILQWLLDNNIKDVNKVGHIMQIYYKYPKLLLDAINDGGDFGALEK